MDPSLLAFLGAALLDSAAVLSPLFAPPIAPLLPLIDPGLL